MACVVPSSPDAPAGIAAISNETLDGENDAGQFTSIAIGDDDDVHISYIYETTADLRYATNDGGAWSTETVDSVTDASGYTSMAIDSEGKVHIAYFDFTNMLLMYATDTGGSWTTDMVDGSGDVSGFISLAVDLNDKVHISYYDSADDDLMYATNAGGSWDISAIDSGDNVGGHSSITVDSHGGIHISYCDYTDTALKYATNATGSWTTSTIDSEGTVGYFTSIAVDSSDHVHISYHDDTNGAVKYATNSGGSWACEAVDGESGIGDITSISIDAEDHVHISYCDRIDVDLMYATNAYGTWSIQTVDSTGDVGSYSSIAVNSTGVAHISYYDSTNHDLKYATVAPCVIHGWVNDSETMQGIEGAQVMAFLTDFEFSPYLDPIMAQTTANETGYYELTLPGGATALMCGASGHYSYTVEFNTTELTEYRLDIILDPEPTVPTADMSLDPVSDVSSHNPLTVSVECEDFNIYMVFIYIGRIQELSGDYVDFHPVAGAAAVPMWDTGTDDFLYTYENDVFEGTYTWTASAEAGYLTNDTASEYIDIWSHRSIDGVESYGIAGYYSNETLEGEVGRAWFDLLTGEYLGFEFGESLLHEPSTLPPAPADDHTGMLTPFSLTYRIATDWMGTGNPPPADFLSYEEQLFEERPTMGLTLRMTYIAPSGDYVALMIVMDEAANYNGSVELFSVDTDAPSADCGSDRTVSCGDEVTLDGSASSDNVGIASYQWDLVDGEAVTLTGAEAAHTFELPGTYAVTLTVYDGAGNSGTDTMTVTVVDDEAPVADAGEAPTDVEAGETVTFNASGSSDNVGIVNFTWELTDAADVVLYGESADYAFSDAGEFLVTLTVRDAAGNSDTDTLTVSVSEAPVNDPPVADAGDDETIGPGSVYTFDGTGSSADVVNHTWTFAYDGEERELYGETPSWTFDIAGEYTVTLTVTDDLGATDADTVLITVEEEGSQLALLVAAGAVAAVAAVGAALLLLRKRKGSGGPPPQG
ncbi:MAG: PKD domain-containing protein [Candidatus Thermoplasmatota archaeon]